MRMESLQLLCWCSYEHIWCEANCLHKYSSQLGLSHKPREGARCLFHIEGIIYAAITPPLLSSVCLRP